MNLLHRPASAIPTPPLVAVATGLVLAAAPLFGRITGWVVALFFAACGARLLMNRHGARLPALPVKIGLFGLGGGGVFLTYNAFLGIEPGLSLLLLLVSLKLLETNTVRDFQVLALLGWFLALCDLFFSQAFGLWLYVSAVFVLLTAALVHFHGGAGAGGFGRAVRRSGWLLLQATPLILLLFFFFPRSRQQFLQFSQSLVGANGMSERLEPGRVGSLALGQEIVFRAEFPDGNLPSTSIMYWRAGVLWRGDGLTWVRGPQLPPEHRPGQLSGGAIRQRIILQPHGARWLYALDRPATAPRGAYYEAGGFLQSERPVLRRMQYEVISRPDNREATISAMQRQETLRKPARISPRLQALVAGWRAAHPGDRELADAALRYFRTEHFIYTLDPGTYGAEALDEFLFERRAGFCEHYAAAYATLMRVAGIPSRVVIGYHGGEYNERGRYVIVRQSDAHAWCEVWIKGEGWLRMDPTDVIAPDRISLGLATFLENRAATQPGNIAPTAVATGWREIQHDLRLAWDNLNYQWDGRILGFDEDQQRTFLTTIGLGDFRWVELAVIMVVGASLLLGGLGLWQRRPGRPPSDAVSRSYARFCTTLAAAGLPREPWEGPLGFGERAATHFAHHAKAIREITALYTRCRYAPAPPPAAAFLHAVRALPRVDRETERGDEK